MAELLGTVVGVVSLGLQVSGGISTYLDGVQCRKEDIDYTKRCCQSMDALLQQIKSLEGQLSASTGADTSAVKEAMTSAGAELSNLGDFTTKICGSNAVHSSITVMEKVRDQKNKLLYPFRKDHLYRLNSRLDTSNATLRSALLQVQLNLSLDQSHGLQGLRTGIDSLSQDVSQARLDVQTSIQEIHSNGAASHTALIKIEKNTADSSSILSATREETMLARNDLAEMKMMLTSLMSSCSDGRAVLPRLVSKPVVLKNICDIAEIDSTEASYDLPFPKRRSHSGFQCTCKPRQLSRRKRQQLGVAFWEQESLTDNVHASWCSFTRLYTTSYDKWSIGISTWALRDILPAAINFSMSATFGAGGFGISPSFTYYPVRKTSPAREALCLLREAFYTRKWSNKEGDSLIRHGLKTLQTTFTARTSSPLEIDYRGFSLLNLISNYVSGEKWQGHQNTIFAFLVGAGAPPDRPAEDKKFPFQFFLPMNSSTLVNNAQALDILWPDHLMDPGLQQAGMEGPTMDEMKGLIMARQVSLKIRKMYEGHMMEAIASKNIALLSKVTYRKGAVSELSEMDPFGHKILHYLPGWPDGLQLILERFGIDSLKLSDQSRVVLLECALRWSGEICLGSRLQVCPSDCSCAQAVQVLLDLECASALPIKLRRQWAETMFYASAKARDMALEDLKSRRQELKQLGLINLSSKQISQMDLGKSKVLDYYTGEVLESLEAIGVEIPPRLRTELIASDYDEQFKAGQLHSIGWRKSCCRTASSRAASVYHTLAACRHYAGMDRLAALALADSLYAKGFLETNLPDADGLTPLVVKAIDGAFPSHLPYRNDWELSIESWLMNHDANIEMQIPYCVVGYSVAHHVFNYVGSCRRLLEDSSPFNLLHNSLKSSGTNVSLNRDSCRCSCSVGGCSPYTCVWKRAFAINRLTRGVLGNRLKADNRRSAMESIRKTTLSVEQACDIPRHIEEAWLRVCTFAMLPLRHTCCREGFQDNDDEEMIEIWDEENIELDRFEVLLAELERKWEELDCPLAEFYRLYWIDRMDEVFRQMDEQTLKAEEIQNMRELGIDLAVRPEPLTPGKGSYEDKDSVEYWCQRMDALVA